MSGFDRIAPFYDPLEWIVAGRILQRARAAHLRALAGRRSVLSAGEGHGKFAALFRSSHPHANLTCVDSSSAMITRARRRVGGRHANIKWIEASLPEWRPATGAHDAIVTCFFLDCFGSLTLPAVIDSLAGGATPDGIWINVDFFVPPRGIAHWRARATLALMHAFFRAACGINAKRLQSAEPELARHGFKRVDLQSFNLGFVASTLWSRG